MFRLINGQNPLTKGLKSSSGLKTAVDDDDIRLVTCFVYTGISFYQCRYKNLLKRKIKKIDKLFLNIHNVTSLIGFY